MFTSIIYSASKFPIKPKINNLFIPFETVIKRFKTSNAIDEPIKNSHLKDNQNNKTYEAYPDYKTQSPYTERPYIRTRYYNRLFFKGTKFIIKLMIN